ncbi:MAG: hypothetical protein A4E73_01997 [Syntrophaceae bacterium PtaU1.Bin231]|nr:MAG: hypothetical protein A4E73_01997 [Syntrophaceae bacterium PtaU1.Bin231]
MKRGTEKDTTDTSMQGENRTPIEKARRIPHRSATEEDYKKMDFWNVGTFHRVTTTPARGTNNPVA